MVYDFFFLKQQLRFFALQDKTGNDLPMPNYFRFLALLAFRMFSAEQVKFTFLSNTFFFYRCHFNSIVDARWVYFLLPFCFIKESRQLIALSELTYSWKYSTNLMQQLLIQKFII